MSRLFFIILLLGGLAGCMSLPSQDVRRDKALAIARQYDVAIFDIAVIPVDYYCRYHRWPEHLVLTPHQQAVLSLVSGLTYAPDPASGFYTARFVLKSQLAGDNFSVPWEMSLSPPAVGFDQVQSLSVLLMSSSYHIMLPFSYEYRCPTLMNSRL